VAQTETDDIVSTLVQEVVCVHRSGSHDFSKRSQPFVDLVEGLGVEGDAHFGATVKHRSRVAADPSQPNLRQVHLIHSELLDDLRAAGYDVAPGELGENITTRGLALLELPVGTRLTIGDAVITVTGLRNPCQQINDFRDGLLKQVVRRDEDGNIVRLAGVMGIVSRSGRVQPGASIRVDLPPEPHHPLTRV
jgi:MOSC domain-containing protein YiiM